MTCRGRFTDYVQRILGRRLVWRLGRALYQQARLDLPNYPTVNGEADLIRAACRLKLSPHRRLTVFDVGANRGDWSRIFLREAELAGVTDYVLFAFEPLAALHDDLRSVLSNTPPRAKAELVGSAASSSPGRSSFLISEDVLAGTHHLTSASSCQVQSKAITVDVVTLDQFSRERDITAIDLIKIDCEGWDARVLSGASELLSRGAVEILQFEYNWRWVETRSFLKDAFEIAGANGLLIGKVVPGRIELFAEWHPELERFFEANFVLLKPEIAAAMNGHLGSFDGRNTYA